jgi:hypothetical protein
MATNNPSQQNQNQQRSGSQQQGAASQGNPQSQENRRQGQGESQWGATQQSSEKEQRTFSGNGPARPSRGTSSNKDSGNIEKSGQLSAGSKGIEEDDDRQPDSGSSANRENSGRRMES